MNIQAANAICMKQLLQQLGFIPFQTRNNSLRYFSPLREERTPSFYVHPVKNLWYDFGAKQGGKTIHFACAWLESQGRSATFRDALRWLDNITWSAPSVPASHHEAELHDGPALVLRATEPVTHPILTQYLKDRGIDIAVARNYLQQLRLFNHNTQKNFFALGFRNEEGGHELRNPFFKGCLKPKTISFIRGPEPKNDTLHLFEGFMDFLSVLTQRGSEQLNGDVIVLNSVSMLKDASAYIRKYSYQLACTWMDNDKAGSKAADELDTFFKNEPGLLHRRMNDTYLDFKDVNDWHMHRLGLKGPALG